MKHVLSLLYMLQELQAGTNLHQVLIGLVQDGQLPAAHAFAATLPRPYHVALAHNCEEHHRLREAVETVKRFKLEHVSIHWKSHSNVCVEVHAL